jgi:gas vesicle protein
MIVKDLVDRVRFARIAREKASRRNAAGMVAIGVSIGCTVGAVAGILLAPRSGKETREDVSRRGSEAWDKIKDNVSAGGHRLGNAIETQGNRVRIAAEKGVDAAREVLRESSGKPEKTEKAENAESKKSTDGKE